MRLFIAINFKASVKDKIQEIIKEMKKAALQGRFVNNEHLHLTLEFLGEVPAEKVEKIKAIMEQVDSQPFTIDLSAGGYFKRREGDIYWLGIEHNELLFSIQAKLHALLSQAGFKLENRAYKPHLTIGRKVIMDDKFAFSALENNIKQISIQVDKIDLMKSHHHQGRLVHTIIYSQKI
jgi:2'-5' RNA ligase